MLDFLGFFPRKGIRSQKCSRSRVIGQFGCSKLLYSVNNSKETSIELVSPDGNSLTALQSNSYVDIISAELSADFEILHITKRIISQKNSFAFVSTFYHIYSSAKSQEIISDTPITVFFLPECSPPNYYLLCFIDHKLSHIHIILTKSNISVEFVRGGLNIPSVISFTYHRTTAKLMVIHEIKNVPHLSEFDMDNISARANIQLPVFIHPLSRIPPELALCPLYPMHLPYFRIMCNRIFCTRYGSNICIIQQLFENIDLFMQFSIDMYPKHFSTIITIPNVRCDLPLCYQQFGSILFLFVINHFMCVVDIAQNPPFISTQTNPFSSGILSDCSVPLPLSHHLIDLNSGDVFEVSVTLSNYSLFTPFMDREKWDLMALLCARICNSKLISSVLRLLCSCNDLVNIVYVVRKIFEFLQCDLISLPDTRKKLLKNYSPCENHTVPTQSINSKITLPFSLPVTPFYANFILQSNIPATQSISNKIVSKSSRIIHKNNISKSITAKLNEIEAVFPSSSLVSRKKTYQILMNQMLSGTRSSEKIEKAANKVIARLEFQNTISLILRSSIDNWKNDENPSEFWLFIIYFSFLSETIFNNFPSIMILRDETESVFDKIGSKTMFRTFCAHGIFNLTSVKNEEVNYWRKRVLNNGDLIHFGSDESDYSSRKSVSSETTDNN